VFWIIMVIFAGGILVAPVLAILTGRRTG